MRHLLALGLSLLTLLTTARASPERAELLRLAGSVWKIEVQRVQGGYALGSGVTVAPERVLTNCHVTRDALAVHVVRGSLRQRAEAQAADPEHDLCLLRVPGLAAPPVALGRSGALQPGQAVLALGYTGGMELQHSAGLVVAMHRLDDASVVQSSNAFTSGASGGGLFDQQLRLVGILTFRLPGVGAHYFSTPVEWLDSLLAHDRSYLAVGPLPAERLAFWQRPAPVQPNFLRAAVLERESRWDELEGLAFNWTRSDAGDPQPWYLHGLALDHLRRWPESQRALEQAVLLQPGSPQAWFRLGLVHAEQGRLDLARQARGRLEGLGSELAGELGRAIETD